MSLFFQDTKLISCVVDTAQPGPLNGMTKLVSERDEGQSEVNKLCGGEKFFERKNDDCVGKLSIILSEILKIIPERVKCMRLYEPDQSNSIFPRLLIIFGSDSEKAVDTEDKVPTRATVDE